MAPAAARAHPLSELAKGRSTTGRPDRNAAGPTDLWYGDRNNGVARMRYGVGAFCLVLLLAQGMSFGAQAQWRPKAESWKTYQLPSGTSVRYPASIFRTEVGPTERGKGQKFKSEDGSAEFAVYSLDNPGNELPRSYLQKNLLVPESKLIYRRVTKRFFVVSSIRGERIFYSRCNFADGIHCVYLEYPKVDKVAWDGAVTRISYSLRPR
jgi:hypothetical protein